MATKIIHKKSSVAGSVPLAADLQPGELAVNLADKIIYTKDTSGNVIEMGIISLNDGEFFIGDSSNESSTANFNEAVDARVAALAIALG